MKFRLILILVFISMIFGATKNLSAAGVGDNVPSNCNAQDFSYSIANVVPSGICLNTADSITVNFDVILTGGTDRYDLSIGFTENGQTIIEDVQCLTTGSDLNSGGCDDFEKVNSPQVANTTLSVSCDIEPNSVIDPFANVDFYLNWEPTASAPNGAEISGPKCNLDPSATGVALPLLPASLTLIKTVINDDGGVSVVSDWTLSANIDGGTAELSGASGVTGTTLVGGDYILSEAGPDNYMETISCSSGVLTGNSLFLTANDVVTCTFTNDDILILADLSITKVDLGTTYTPGGIFSYTITVTNNGPDAGDGAVVADALGAWAVNPIWTCTASGSAVCPNPSGSGSISETIATFPNGGQVVYVLSGTFSTDMADY